MQSYSNIDGRKKFTDLTNNFLFSLYSKSENTQKAYSKRLNHFVLEMQDIDYISLEHIESYIIRLQNKYKPSSVNLAINVIKSFYNYLAKYGYSNIGQSIKTVPMFPPEQRVLSKKEYESICTNCKNDCKLDCFKFLCNTGLRVSEFISLKLENVANGFLRVIGKGRKNRSIPMNRIVVEILQRNNKFEMIKHRNRLWIFRICKSLALEAGIPKFHPHSCRHYFANELYHRGVDMFTISRLLGHSSTSVTENVYVHWSEESLAGTTDVLI